MTTLEKKTEITIAIVKSAGALALKFFQDLANLDVEKKGHQDFVSRADKEVELYIRTGLERAFPHDCIVGEEHDTKTGNSGFTWVIDPIDGTNNFINGIPAWTIVLAGVCDDKTQIGIIFDACHDECFVAISGMGSRVNNMVLQKLSASLLTDGSVGVGFSNRVKTRGVNKAVEKILDAGGMFHRNASGALSLAYVADGRLLGYTEEHMNAWDCLAGQLLVAEVGGGVEIQSADTMITQGGRVVVGAPGVFEVLIAISDEAYIL